MTIVGHSIVGIALGLAILPRGRSRWATAGMLIMLAALACLPDWRIPFHRDLFEYQQHHSLLANLVIIAIIAAGMAIGGVLKGRRGWLILTAVSAAILSHLVLDSMYGYANPKGLNVGWPFGVWRYPLPVPWLHVQTNPGSFDWTHNRIRLIEVLTFGPLVALAALLRPRLHRKQSTPPQSQQT